MSMWAVGQVNSRWRSIVDMTTNQLYWKQSIYRRWPLLNVMGDIDNWYEVSINKNYYYEYFTQFFLLVLAFVFIFKMYSLND